MSTDITALTACALTGDAQALVLLHDALLDLGYSQGYSAATVEAVRCLVRSSRPIYCPEWQYLSEEDRVILFVEDYSHHEDLVTLLWALSVNAVSGPVDYGPIFPCGHAVNQPLLNLFSVRRDGAEALINRFFGYNGELAHTEDGIRIHELDMPLTWRIAVRPSLISIEPATTKHGYDGPCPPAQFITFTYYA